MSNVIPFPNKEFTLLERREEMVEAFFDAVSWEAHKMNMNLEDLEFSGAVFSMLRELVDEHLNLGVKIDQYR